MLKVKALLASALLAATASVYAQAPAQPAPADAGKGAPRHHMRDCSQTKDPKACEERRTKVREAAKKAHAACDAKQGDEKRECMRKEMCAQAKDPAKCEARAQAHAEKRKQRREAEKKPGEKK